MASLRFILEVSSINLIPLGLIKALSHICRKMDWKSYWRHVIVTPTDRVWVHNHLVGSHVLYQLSWGSVNFSQIFTIIRAVDVFLAVWNHAKSARKKKMTSHRYHTEGLRFKASTLPRHHDTTLPHGLCMHIDYSLRSLTAGGTTRVLVLIEVNHLCKDLW